MMTPHISARLLTPTSLAVLAALTVADLVGFDQCFDGLQFALCSVFFHAKNRNLIGYILQVLLGENSEFGKIGRQAKSGLFAPCWRIYTFAPSRQAQTGGQMQIATDSAPSVNRYRRINSMPPRETRRPHRGAAQRSARSEVTFFFQAWMHSRRASIYLVAT